MATSNAIKTQNYDLPLSGIVCQESPQSTLWNVYNVMETMGKAIDDLGDDCSEWGIQLLFRECQKAIAYEADRVNALMESLSEEPAQ